MFVFLIATDFAYKDPLQNYSLTLIPKLQAGASEHKIEAWGTFSDAMEDWLNAPVVIFLFFPFKDHRWRTFYYIIAWGGTEYLKNTLKMQFHAPRPYWRGEDVQAFHCAAGYGNPSGHTIISMGRPLLYWLDYQEVFKTGGVLGNVVTKVILLCVALGMGTSVAYSRLFLGDHSVDEVLLSTLLAFWFDLTLHFCVRDDLC